MIFISIPLEEWLASINGFGRYLESCIFNLGEG